MVRASRGKRQKEPIDQQIRDTLMENIRQKSKLYNLPEMSPIFLLNNFTYILNHLPKPAASQGRFDPEASKLRAFAEDLKRSIVKLRGEYHKTWKQCFSYLHIPEEDQDVKRLDCKIRRVRHKIKDKFKGFNTSFERAYRVQSNLVVPDPTLRG